MGQRVALLLANSEYRDSNLSDLTAPKADLTGLAAVLRDEDIGRFDQVRVVHNKGFAATSKEIAKFFRGRKRDDLLFLYFTGHGVLDEYGELYLAVKNTEHELLSATAISAKFISTEMDRSYCWSQILILDCCHSGAFARGTKGATGGRVRTELAFQGDGSGRVILTATDSTQYAWEGDKILGESVNKSLFTHYLVEGLESGEADLDRDGQVTIDELYEYTFARVSEETPKQTPGKWSFKQQGEIVVARSQFEAAHRALPNEIAHAVSSPLASVRSGALETLEHLLGNEEYCDSALEAIRGLMNDDSRMISGMAARTLAAHEAANTSSWTPPAPHKGLAAVTEEELPESETKSTASPSRDRLGQVDTASEPTVLRFWGIRASIPLVILAAFGVFLSVRGWTGSQEAAPRERLQEPVVKEDAANLTAMLNEHLAVQYPPDGFEYHVQLFSTTDPAKASGLLAELRGHREDAFISEYSPDGGINYYRILIGPFHSLPTADPAKAEVLATDSLRSWATEPFVRKGGQVRN